MKNLSMFLFLLIGVLLTSCNSPENTQASIVINLAGTGQDKLEVFNIEKEIHHQLTGPKDSITLSLKEATILDLVQGRTHHYIHVQPNSNLQIDTLNAAELLLGVSKNPSKENIYLADFAKLVTEQSTNFFTPDITKKEVDSFLIILHQKYEPLHQLVAEIEKEEAISDAFKMTLNYRLIANKGNDLLTYKNMYNYWHKSYPELPDGFYKDIETLDFTNPTLLTFDAGRRLGLSWSNKDVSYFDYSSVKAYYAACMNYVDKKYPASLLRDYCLYDVVYNNVNFGGGIDDADTMITNFKASVSNLYLNNKLTETLAPWLALKSGLDAPNFIAKKRNDEAVSLSALKGKRVYIDVWATWCGPCIQEIPALKQLESDLHGENIEFVSISIDDDKDKEKWLNFIEDKALTGLQLMAENAWQSDLAIAYNIKGIPRFLLIDEKGKIISANAPRPSDPGIKDVLLN